MEKAVSQQPMRPRAKCSDREAGLGREGPVRRAPVALPWRPARHPWIVAGPGTTLLAHLQEHRGALNVPVSSGGPTIFTATFGCIPIGGDRCTGPSARQINPCTPPPPPSLL